MTAKSLLTYAALIAAVLLLLYIIGRRNVQVAELSVTDTETDSDSSASSGSSSSTASASKPQLSIQMKYPYLVSLKKA